MLLRNKVKEMTDERHVKCVSGIHDDTYVIRFERERDAVREKLGTPCDTKAILIELRTTTYESNSQPYVSSTLKILSSVTRALKQVLHAHVTTGAAIVVPRWTDSSYRSSTR